MPSPLILPDHLEIDLPQWWGQMVYSYLIIIIVLVVTVNVTRSLLPYCWNNKLFEPFVV